MFISIPRELFNPSITSEKFLYNSTFDDIEFIDGIELSIFRGKKDDKCKGGVEEQFKYDNCMYKKADEEFLSSIKL